MEQYVNLQGIWGGIMEYGPRLMMACVALYGGFWVVRCLDHYIGLIIKKTNLDLTIKNFLLSLISVGLKILMLLTLADLFGIETTSFIAIFSALAFAVGMALQGSLGHFASGVLLLIFKPYNIGDLVDIDGRIGHVKEIRAFSTVLRTLDNKSIIIPNGIITGNVITNISGQGLLRVDMTFGIGYGDDIDLARQVIRQVAESCQYISKEKLTEIFVSELGDSSVNFVVRPWCASEHYWEVHFYMTEYVKKEFDANGISIPFPQMDIHLHSEVNSMPKQSTTVSTQRMSLATIEKHKQLKMSMGN
ncbi:MAG: mechanosensitive ion channel domain-containing protein [Bacteroidota bacterium]